MMLREILSYLLSIMMCVFLRSRDTQPFISVDNCSEGLIRLRNSDFVVNLI